MQQNRVFRFDPRDRWEELVVVVAAAIVWCCLLNPIPGLSQAITTATLTGVVTDPGGAVVPGAIVIAKNEGTSVEYKASTNEQGLYRLLSLPPATYDVSVTVTGFQTSVRRNVQLYVNQSSTQDFSLQLGAVEQQIEVTGAAVTLQTGTASLGTVIDSRKVVDLPLNGRQFTQLMLLAPGVSPIVQKQDVAPGIGTRSSQLGGSAFVPSVNGQPARSNLFFVDGIIDSDPFFTGFSIAPSIDIIQEFNIESHNDTAEVGQAVGGIVNVITKSGSDSVHGTVYEFNRNKAVEARNFFDPANRPNFNQNQFGFTVGGPAPFLKGKVWFHGGYEGFRFTRGSTIFSRVPTDAEWGGNFSGFLRSQVGTDALGRSVLQGQVFNPFTGRETKAGVNDPVTGLTAVRDGFVRDPFPGNLVPQSLFNPIRAWRRWVPAPNLPTAPGSLDPNFLNSQSSRLTQDGFNVRLDYRLSSKDTVYGRYLFSASEGLNPAALPSVPSKNVRDFHNVGLHWVRNFNPTTLIDLRAGYQNGRSPGFSAQPEDKRELFRDAGFDRPDSAYILGAGGGLEQFPAIGIQDFAGTGSSSGAGYDPQRVTQFAGDFTKVKGRHTFKAGAIWFHTHMTHFGACPSVSFGRPQTGDFSNRLLTGNGLASFLLGVPSGGLIYSGQVGATLDTDVYGIYAQDSLKVSPKLTLNFGLRWDYSSPPVEKKDRLSAWDQSLKQFVLSGSTPPPDCATTGGSPPCIPGGRLPANVIMFGKRGIVNPVKDNFSPRLGLAYQLQDRTVVRAGIGAYFDNWAFLVQNSQDPRGGWPFGLIRGTPAALNEGLFQVSAQTIVPRVSSPPPTPFPAGRRVNDSNFKNAYVASWNIDVQRQVTNSLTITGAYVGSKGRRTYTGFLQNTALTPGPGPIQDRVPFPLLVPAAFGGRSIGASWYNSFQFKAEQRFDRGLSYLITYTWQKSMDLGCSGFAGIEGCQIQDPYNIQNDKSVSSHDIPQRINLSYVWELPFGKGRSFLNQGGLSSHILGNWQVNGIIDYYSGQPVTITTGFDTANTGSNANRPDQIGNPIPANRSRLNWFDINAFKAAPDCRLVPRSECRFGTLGRNTLRGPRFGNWDFSIFRDFPISERLGRIQFRTEFFNIFNNTNFLTSGLNSGMSLSAGASFGRIFAAAPARQIQFAGKWIF